MTDAYEQHVDATESAREEIASGPLPEGYFFDLVSGIDGEVLMGNAPIDRWARGELDSDDS